MRRWEIIGILLFAFGILIPVFSYAQAPAEQKATIQQQMDALQKEIDELDNQLDQTHKEKESLAQQIEIFNTEIKKRQLEMKRLALAITEAEQEIKKKNADISRLSEKIEKLRDNLQENLAAFQRYQQASILEALLTYSSLSQFFDSINNLERIQAEIQTSLADMRDTRKNEERARDDLFEFKQSQASLRSLRELERRVIEQNKKEKNELLRLTKGKEALFQSILNQKKKNLAALKSQLFYLERTGVSAEDALKYARLAADRAGIRVEFLLALLEVETGRQYEDGVITAGTYIGTGNWKTDLYDCYVRLGKRTTAETQKKALFSITEKLGFDPDKMPVSRRPYYGCGGAIGPAQFLPSTWLLFDDRVEELVGRSPANPWNIEDSFTAAALYLADAGAASKTEAGEQRAARAYISGNPVCPARGSARTACLGYSRQILSLAKEIAKNIN